MAKEAPAGDFRSFADVLNRLSKTVVSGRLSVVGRNARVLSAPLDEAMRILKGEYPGEIVAVGEMKLARGLLASGELDEVRLLRLPRIAVRGRSILATTGSIGDSSWCPTRRSTLAPSSCRTKHDAKEWATCINLNSSAISPGNLTHWVPSHCTWFDEYWGSHEAHHALD
jgi:hypothetical protein